MNPSLICESVISAAGWCCWKRQVSHWPLLREVYIYGPSEKFMQVSSVTVTHWPLPRTYGPNPTPSSCEKFMYSKCQVRNLCLASVKCHSDTLASTEGGHARWLACSYCCHYYPTHHHPQLPVSTQTRAWAPLGQHFSDWVSLSYNQYTLREACPYQNG